MQRKHPCASSYCTNHNRPADNESAEPETFEVCTSKTKGQAYEARGAQTRFEDQHEGQQRAASQATAKTTFVFVLKPGIRFILSPGAPYPKPKDTSWLNTAPK